ncbi:MAG: M28 family peptidase [Ferruginibacter sp.]
MKKILFGLCIISFSVTAQKLKKADKIIVTDLQTNIGYLADDKLEGRRTGTPGEKLAYEFISTAFQNAGLQPKGNNGTYLQEFEVNDGRQINPSTHFIINGNDLKLNKEFFPLSISPNASIESVAAVAVQESKNIWFWDLKEILTDNKNNPHFDLNDAIKTKLADITSKGATGLIIYNTSAIDDEIKFEPKIKPEYAKIPVLYVTKMAKEKYLIDETATLDIKLKVDVSDKKRWGHNVIGYLDNGAATTIIIGAHYDHLGYGEDHNSLYAGTVPMIHNGADDNASGTGALIELSKLLKASKLKKNNYLFIAFSGEELGLYGSKHFTDHPTIDLSTANYMINMDMVGRLNDSTHAMTVGGFGTSPAWSNIIINSKNITVKIDSSGTGPSDHTSFYRKDIPVLFFFTGTHSDYHKPSDDADKINYTGELQVIRYIYDVIGTTEKKDKLVFTKTREQTMAKNSFKVTIGVMIDYTYSGGDGIKIDGVSDGRPAQKAGIKPGDIISQLGDHKFSDVNEYMGALNKFNKGDSTKAKVKRGKDELLVDITF